MDLKGSLRPSIVYVLTLQVSKQEAREIYIYSAQAIRDVLRGSNDHNQLKLCHNIHSMN